MRECCGGPRHEPPPPRSKSTPPAGLIPSEDMGEYEDMRRRRSAPEKSRPKGGGLFPLDEEGEYGAPPSSVPKPLPGYKKRERKPKVYASYAVSNECDLHVSKLERNEKDRGKTPPRTTGRSGRTSTASSRPSSRASLSPHRSRTTSASPDRYRQMSSPDPSTRRSVKKSSNTSTTRNGFSSSKYRSSSYSKVSRDLRESSFEENEEYEMYENKKAAAKGGKISLDSLRVPEFDADSMGILGLSSRMWNAASTQKSSISATSFVRKESMSSYVV